MEARVCFEGFKGKFVLSSVLCPTLYVLYGSVEALESHTVWPTRLNLACSLNSLECWSNLHGLRGRNLTCATYALRLWLKSKTAQRPQFHIQPPRSSEADNEKGVNLKVDYFCIHQELRPFEATTSNSTSEGVWGKNLIIQRPLFWEVKVLWGCLMG